MNADAEIPSPPGAWELVTLAAEAIESRLPPKWGLKVVADIQGMSRRRSTALFKLTAPDGTVADLVVQAKSQIEGRDIPLLEQKLGNRIGGLGGDPLVVARYLSSGVRQRLVERNLSYVDATGNLHLSLREPALFLRDVGAERDPWRGPGRPRSSFRGAIAARVIRALADFTPPITVPRLIERSEVSTGAAYRVVDFLEREDLLERELRGPITRVDWRPMLERWAQDYRLNLEGRALRLLAPRGIKALQRRLSTFDESSYALTGSVAAGYFEEYAQARLALIYADNPRALADRLDLRPVETGPNVLVLAAADEVVFARARIVDGVKVAAPSQIVVDLLNGPGRAPNEAQALLDWMESNEAAWRY